jgi:hypothetical protein
MVTVPVEALLLAKLPSPLQEFTPAPAQALPVFEITPEELI